MERGELRLLTAVAWQRFRGRNRFCFGYSPCTRDRYDAVKGVMLIVAACQLAAFLREIGCILRLTAVDVEPPAALTISRYLLQVNPDWVERTYQLLRPTRLWDNRKLSWVLTRTIAQTLYSPQVADYLCGAALSSLSQNATNTRPTKLYTGKCNNPVCNPPTERSSVDRGRARKDAVTGVWEASKGSHR